MNHVQRNNITKNTTRTNIFRGSIHLHAAEASIEPATKIILNPSFAHLFIVLYRMSPFRLVLSSHLEKIEYT